MKVILLEYVYKHGVAGEVIDVADGFARNYLIPKGLAVKATAGELKKAESLREQAVVRRAALENQLNEIARQIDGVELIFGRRAAITGKLFGSVTTQEIADALLEETGLDINRRRISQQALREVGLHEVPVRLGNELSPVLKITIVPEQELAEFLAAREAGDEPVVTDEGEIVATAEPGEEIEPEAMAVAEVEPVAAEETEVVPDDET
jgi:large subunit ribosomal protein L9